MALFRLGSLLALVAGAASLATAPPKACPPDGHGHHPQHLPEHPDYHTGRAFNLIANVSNPSHGFAKSVQGAAVVSLHVGAALSSVGLMTPDEYSRVFYTNGTVAEVHAGHGSIVSDNSGFPEGLKIIVGANGNGQGDQVGPEHPTSMDAGYGTPGIRIVVAPRHHTLELAAPEHGTFAACNATLPYYGNDTYFPLVTFIGGGIKHVPHNCVAINLLPQCAPLNNLTAGSFSSHNFTQPTPCYPNVTTIDWKKYV